jgi:hypothetical protein
MTAYDDVFYRGAWLALLQGMGVHVGNPGSAHALAASPVFANHTRTLQEKQQDTTSKIPLLCLCITSVAHHAFGVHVRFKDPFGTVTGCVQKQVLKEWPGWETGACVALRNVAVFAQLEPDAVQPIVITCNNVQAFYPQNTPTPAHLRVSSSSSSAALVPAALPFFPSPPAVSQHTQRSTPQSFAFPLGSAWAGETKAESKGKKEEDFDFTLGASSNRVLSALSQDARSIPPSPLLPASLSSQAPPSTPLTPAFSQTAPTTVTTTATTTVQPTPPPSLPREPSPTHRSPVSPVSPATLSQRSFPATQKAATPTPQQQPGEGVFKPPLLSQQPPPQQLGGLGTYLNGMGDEDDIDALMLGLE